MDLAWTSDTDSLESSRSADKTTFGGRVFQMGTNIREKNCNSYSAGVMAYIWCDFCLLPLVPLVFGFSFNFYLMYSLNELMVTFTLYFDIENVKKSSRNHYDENTVVPPWEAKINWIIYTKYWWLDLDAVLMV